MAVLVSTPRLPVTLPGTTPRPRSTAPPPLEPGDRLTRAEFERRYAKLPTAKKVELIEGVVFMPSPVRYEGHAEPHAQMIVWLGVYRALTPGSRTGDNASVRIDLDNELQPDVLLRIEPGAGGASRIADDDFVEGPPELVVEIAGSSVSYDLHAKLNVYRRNGVQEYLVWRVNDQAIDWFYLHEGEYLRLAADDTGRTYSRIFPGLWLNVQALLAGDMVAVLATLQEGLQSAEHTQFVTLMQERLTADR